MGMYTEIYISADLKKETPEEVIEALRAICDKNLNSPILADKPGRWPLLFNSGSYYTPNTEAHQLTNDVSGEWSIIGKGDIKNYENEIQQFFDWIKPWCEDGFIGYYRYEEDWEPTLVFVGNPR